MSDTPHDKLPRDVGPAGGWGSVRGMVTIARTARPSPGIMQTLVRQNKPGGMMCAACAWPKPANYHPFEFCENGAKATIWESTKARHTPDFWKTHTVSELLDWSDHDLEMTGRLTHPMHYDAATDRYVECGWQEAIDDIAAKVKALAPDETVFYSAGHAALEPAFLWGLMARLHGTNNLPQSSNMCHETTSVGLKKVIGSPVGTVVWEDLEAADCFFFFGQNPGTNSPRFLHPLQEAKQRGASIVTFNPVKEQGLVSFVAPQDPVAMATGRETVISDQYHQLKGGSDIAAIMGLCKAVIEADDAAGGTVIDWAFLNAHTTGFDAFIDRARAADWAAITAECGLSEDAIRQAADVYIKAERVIAVYGMGLTQHAHGADNIGMLVNLMLLRGNIGRKGAGMCPVRGHSNVQGQRTVGIAEKADLIPMDRLRDQFDFEPPTKDGTHIVDAAEGIIDGSIKAMVCLGGNLMRAMPDTARLEAAWRDMEVTATISTRLNRSHLYPGKTAYILPCLARTEADMQATGNQTVSIEDSFSMIHGSIAKRSPASDHLKSELAITAELAKALTPASPKRPWDEWVDDYSKVRDLIAATYPDDFADFNARLHTPGGFWRNIAAHHRIWKTDSGKAEFTTPQRLNALAYDAAPGRYTLLTMRSNDQFNTTIYGYSDRFRGIEGTRSVVLMNAADMAREKLSHGDIVALVGDAGDNISRRLEGLTVTRFDLPEGTVGSYYPECNVLVPLGLHDQLSKTPGSKAVPVRIEPMR